MLFVANLIRRAIVNQVPEHILTRKLTLDLPIETVFDVFDDAGNLDAIGTGFGRFFTKTRG